MKHHLARDKQENSSPWPSAWRGCHSRGHGCCATGDREQVSPDPLSRLCRDLIDSRYSQGESGNNRLQLVMTTRISRLGCMALLLLLPMIAHATEVAVSPRYTARNFTISWGGVGVDEVEVQERPGTTGSNWSPIYRGRGTSITRYKTADGTWSYRARRCIPPEPGFPGFCQSWGAVKLVSIEKTPGRPVMGGDKDDSDGTYRVSWSAASGTVTGYTLYERVNGGNWTRAGGVSAGLTARDISGKSDGAYDYQAKACNHVGCGSLSSNLQTITVSHPPSTPGAIQISPGSQRGRVRLSWTASTGDVDYYQLLARKVGHSCPGISSEWCAAQSSSSTSYDADLDDGDYQFKVRACGIFCSDYTSVSSLSVSVPRPSISLDHRSIRIHGVGAVGDDEDGFLYTASSSRVVALETTQGGQCRNLVVVNDRGRFMGESRNCEALSLYLDTGTKIRLFAANGASTSASPARCALHVNGSIVGSTYCGWRYLGLKDISSEEVLQIVHLPPEDFLPPESMGHHAANIVGRLFWVGADRQASFIKNHYAGGGARQVMQTYGSVEEAVLLVGLESAKALSIPVQFLKNDYLVSDPDGDGLGSLLEYEILLCNGLDPRTADGLDCTGLADTRDTDGDGIRDDWELLGRRDPSLGADQPLAYWGAYPRHKDLFFEINYVRKVPTDPFIQTVEPDAARHAHAYWSFAGNAYRPVVTDPVRIADNAEDLANPDGEPGIALHLDTGRFPQSVTDWTMYGNWGGYKVHQPTNCRVEDGKQVCDFVRISSRYDLMQEIRYGLFKLDLVFNTTGGGAGWGLASAHGVAADFARVSEVLTHEGGHTLGLDHSSPFQVQRYVRPGYTRDDNGLNCDAFYFSIMNYTYETRFSTDLREAVNGTAPYMPHTFADGHMVNKQPFHMDALQEFGAVDYYLKNPVPSVREYALNMLHSQKSLIVDEGTGSVDWNRDGYIQGPGETVRAGVNHEGGYCEEGRLGRTDLVGHYARQSLSSESYGGVMQIAWVDSDRNAYWKGSRITTCPGQQCNRFFPEAEPFRPGGQTRVGDKVKLLAGVDAVDISSVLMPDQSRVLLALGIDYFGSLRMRYTADNAGWYWSPGVSQDALDESGRMLEMKGEPEVVAFDNLKQIVGVSRQAAAAVFVHDLNDQVFVAYLMIGSKGTSPPWELTEFAPVKLAGASGGIGNLVVNTPVNSVAGLYMYPHDVPPAEVQSAGLEKELHIFWGSGTQIDVARMETYDTFRVQKNPVHTVDSSAIAEGSKVAPVMMNTVNGNPEWQQLYVYYLRADGALMSSKARMIETGSPPPDDQQYQVYAWGFVDFADIRGTLISVAYDSHGDSQPRMVHAHKYLDKDGNPETFHQSIEMRPAPEGIAVRPSWGFNDWLTLKYALCHQVAKGGDGQDGARSKVAELGFEPVRCLPIPDRDETSRD